MSSRTVRRTVAAFALVALGAVAFALRAPLSRGLFAAAIDAASGYRVAFDRVRLDSNRTILDGVRVDVGGTPLLRARQVTVRYELRDLFPGGRRRYGLTSLDLVGPDVTLVRRSDGTFALHGGSAGAGTGAAAGTGGAPLEMTVRIRDGSLTVLDPSRRVASARRLRIGAIAGEATIDQRTRTVYRFGGDLADDRAQHLRLAGISDVLRRFGLHRLWARSIGLAAPANYFINTPSAALERGIAHDLDVRVYGFASPAGRFAYHVAGSARVSGGVLRVPGMIVPLHGIAGRLDVTDRGLVVPRWTASLGPLPVRLAGALYDWQAPRFRVGLLAPRADFGAARGLFAFSRRLPVGGVGRAAALLEGPVAAPILATTIAAPRLRYGHFPLDEASARVFYQQGTVDVLGARAGYGGLSLQVGGALALGDVLRTQLVVGARGPAARLPYLAALAPSSEVDAIGLLRGRGLSFDAAGAVAGSGGGTTLAGTFAVDSAGDGTLGPLTIARSDGARLAGAFNLHRSTQESGFWIEAHDYPYDAPLLSPQLPGVTISGPAFAGRLDGKFAGAGRPSTFRLAGVVRATGLRVGGVALDAASGSVAGAFGSLRLHGVTAKGPWGSFAGDGTYLAGRLALAGGYRGSFAQLATFTGDVRARGPVDGPVALVIEPQRTIVQVLDAATPGATVAGLSLADLDGTLAVAHGSLHVYGATAQVGGGSAAAAGGFERHIGLSLGGVAGGGAIVLPNVAPGRLWAIGTVSLADGRPRFDGGAAITQARVRGEDATGNGDIGFSAARLALHDVDGRIGTTLGTIAGTVSAPGTSRVAFDLGLRLPAAPLGPLLRGSALARQDVAGTAQAALQVRGVPASYSVAGRVGVPEGVVNGLAFRDLTMELSLGRYGLAAREGAVTIGSTQASFGGSLEGARSSARLSVPAADLADFNDYFDAGDTLAGHGRIALRFAESGAVVTTSADVALHGLRYRRFELGDALARWTSRGRDVALKLGFGGPTGTFRTAGTLLLPAAAPPTELVRASAFRGTAQLRDLDLGVWLPALGYAAPLGGRLDADAAIAGRLADPTVRTSATVVDGSFGTVPVRRLHLTASSTLHRTTLEEAEIALPSVDLTGNGSFGFGAHDLLALAVHAKSPNLGTVATRLFGTAGAVSGSGEADLHIAGTRSSPIVTGGFDLEAATVRGVSIPRTLGQFSLRGRDVVLSGVEVQFARGAAELAGSLPLQIAPFGFGPAQAPVALQAELRAIDLADFAPLLPAGSMLAGTLDGGVAIEGTAGAPRLGGSVSLTNGGLRSPAETIPLERIAATVSLAGRTATLQRFHAEAGGGTLDASGAATFPDLDRVRQAATYTARLSARNLHLNVPAYGSGQIDGSLVLARAAAARAQLGGDLVLSDATIPFSALLLPGGGGTGRTFLPDLVLDLGMRAGRNVRVRSANVDIGASGGVHVEGDLTTPRLRGAFTSTGGTLTYFNTVFRLQDGTVRFAPDQGVIPTLDAVATTHVIDPDPNTVRNAAGSADVTLNLAGPVTNLSITLSSQPAYDREQILGLLLGAPALGASNLFGENAGSPTLYGSNATSGLNPAVIGNRNTSGELSVAQEAFGFANAQFTRTLLAPFETSFASAVGLSNFNVNVDYTGNVGLQARKAVGKKINALFGTSFGYPYRQTFGFEYKPNAYSAAQVTVFQTLGATGLNSLTPTASITNTSRLQAAQPETGSAGVSFSLQRLFP